MSLVQLPRTRFDPLALLHARQGGFLCPTFRPPVWTCGQQGVRVRGVAPSRRIAVSVGPSRAHFRPLAWLCGQRGVRLYVGHRPKCLTEWALVYVCPDERCRKVNKPVYFPSPGSDHFASSLRSLWSERIRAGRSGGGPCRSVFKGLSLGHLPRTWLTPCRRSTRSK